MTKAETLLQDFSAIGVNHWSAPVMVRERFSLSDAEKMALYAEAKKRGIEQLIIVSTCNRTELFSYKAETSELINLLIDFSRGNAEEFEEHGFETFGEDAVRHLFEVAAGLDAQILGDLQIVKQVKDSYDLAHEAHMVGSSFHRLMHTVFRTHKRIRKETDLGMGAASVASAAVQFAQHHFRNFSEKKVVLVGTGKMGTVTCKNLINLGVKDITLVNRSEEKALFIAGEFGVSYSGMAQLPEVLAKADLVIVATGSILPVINLETLAQVPTDGTKRFYIDLSVPRNIDEDVKQHPSIVLINMDDLQNSMDQTYSKRKASVPMANQIIRNELHSYRAWLSEQLLIPHITEMNLKLEVIRRAEMDKLKHHFSAEDWEKVELLTHRIIRKVANEKLEEMRESML
ncbi:glutamyl-tRNA reductase [bacterium]|nr:MAG: glutamyl-tRNA reductase [bacterium]